MGLTYLYFSIELPIICLAYSKFRSPTPSSPLSLPYTLIPPCFLCRALLSRCFLRHHSLLRRTHSPPSSLRLWCAQNDTDSLAMPAHLLDAIGHSVLASVLIFTKINGIGLSLSSPGFFPKSGPLVSTHHGAGHTLSYAVCQSRIFVFSNPHNFTIAGDRCDAQGHTVPPGTPPPPRPNDENSFFPFESRVQFELGEWLFKKDETSSRNVKELLDLWAADVFRHNDTPPFANVKELHELLDAIPQGDAPWESFKMTYNGPLPASSADTPVWMLRSYTVWFRNPKTVLSNQLGNPDFNDEFDSAPHQDFTTNGKRKFQNLMSANWSWKEAVRLFSSSISITNAKVSRSFRLKFKRPVVTRWMGPLFVLSFWAATRQWSLLRPAKRNTIHYTCRQGTCITMFDVHTGMLSLHLHFLPSQNVRR